MNTPTLFHDPTSEPSRAVHWFALEALELLLAERGEFLGGGQPSIGDLFIAPDLFALDIDPDREELFGGLGHVNAWLESLRSRTCYGPSHAAWNAIVPKITGLIVSSDSAPRDPGWVSEACLEDLR